MARSFLVRASGGFDQPDQQQKYDGANDRVDDGRDHPGAEADANRGKKPARNEGADDADDDVADKAETITLDNQPCEPAGNRTDNDEDKQAFDAHCTSLPDAAGGRSRIAPRLKHRKPMRNCAPPPAASSVLLRLGPPACRVDPFLRVAVDICPPVAVTPAGDGFVHHAIGVGPVDNNFRPVLWRRFNGSSLRHPVSLEPAQLRSFGCKVPVFAPVNYGRKCLPPPNP